MTTVQRRENWVHGTAKRALEFYKSRNSKKFHEIMESAYKHYLKKTIWNFWWLADTPMTYEEYTEGLQQSSYYTPYESEFSTLINGTDPTINLPMQLNIQYSILLERFLKESEENDLI